MSLLLALFSSMRCISAEMLASHVATARPWSRVLISSIAMVILSVCLCVTRLELLTVRGVSMEHTLANGDVLVVLRTPWPGASVKRGSIIVFASPYKQNEVLVKRVVAVGGDRVKIQDGHLIVNGHLRGAESSVRPWKDSWGWFTDNPEGVLVPHAQYFVLSDNRSSLADSRSFGSVPASLVKGLVIGSW